MRANRPGKALTHSDLRESRPSTWQAGSVGSVWGVRTQKKTRWLHALAIRAAVVAAAAVVVAAAVPELSPPASQLWGATPESPYWSLEWAETHFLWAQVTWCKEQKGLRQVVVKGWRGWGKVVGCVWDNAVGEGWGQRSGGTRRRGSELGKK